MATVDHRAIGELPARMAALKSASLTLGVLGGRPDENPARAQVAATLMGTATVHGTSQVRSPAGGRVQGIELLGVVRAGGDLAAALGLLGIPEHERRGLAQRGRDLARAAADHGRVLQIDSRVLEPHEAQLPSSEIAVAERAATAGHLRRREAIPGRPLRGTTADLVRAAGARVARLERNIAGRGDTAAAFRWVAARSDLDLRPEERPRYNGLVDDPADLHCLTLWQGHIDDVLLAEGYPPTVIDLVMDRRPELVTNLAIEPAVYSQMRALTLGVDGWDQPTAKAERLEAARELLTTAGPDAVAVSTGHGHSVSVDALKRLAANGGSLTGTMVDGAPTAAREHLASKIEQHLTHAQPSLRVRERIEQLQAAPQVGFAPERNGPDPARRLSVRGG